MDETCQHEIYQWRASDGLPLFGRAWRPAAAPRAVVCLVHGIGEHSGRYEAMGRALAAAGYLLLGADLRGHGRSAGVRGHAPAYDRLLDDLALLIEEARRQCPEQPLFFYGHSMGGNLVLNYLLRRRPPAAGVVTAGPLLRLAAAPPRWKLAAGRLCYWLWPTCLFHNGVDIRACTRDAVIVREHEDDPLGHSRVSARLGLDLLEAGAWALDHAGELPCPALIMRGGEDRVTDAGAIAEFAARSSGACTLKVWEGALHELHSEPNREAIFAYLIDWLTAQLPA